MRRTILAVSKEKQNARYFIQQYGNHFRGVSKWIEVIAVAIILYKSFYCRYKIANHLLSRTQRKGRCLIANVRFNPSRFCFDPERRNYFGSHKELSSRVNYFVQLTSHIEIRFISIKSTLKTRWRSWCGKRGNIFSAICHICINGRLAFPDITVVWTQCYVLRDTRIHTITPSCPAMSRVRANASINYSTARFSKRFPWDRLVSRYINISCLLRTS